MKSEKNSIRTGSVFLLVMTALLWGSGFPIRKMTLEYMNPLYMCAVRYTIGAVLMYVFYRFWRRKKPLQLSVEERIPKKKQIMLGFFMGIMAASTSALQQFAMPHTNVGNISFLTSLYIIVVPIITSLFQKKNIGKKMWCCVAMAVIGIYLLGGGMHLSFNFGDFLALMSTLTFTGQVLIIDKYGAKSDPIFLSSLETAFAAVLFWITTVLFETGNTVADIEPAIWLLLYAAIFSLALPFTFQIMGQEHVESSLAAIILSLESVFGAVFGIVILHEQMGMIKALGCVMLLSATVLGQIKLPRKESRKHEEQ